MRKIGDLLFCAAVLGCALVLCIVAFHLGTLVACRPLVGRFVPCY